MGGRNPVVTAVGSSRDAGRIHTRASFESWLDFQRVAASLRMLFWEVGLATPDANVVYVLYSVRFGTGVVGTDL